MYGNKSNADLARESDQQLKYCKRGVSRKLPNDFFCSKRRHKALLELVDKQQTCLTTQELLDRWYDDMSHLVHDKMGKYSQNKQYTPKMKKMFKQSKGSVVL